MMISKPFDDLTSFFSQCLFYKKHTAVMSNDGKSIISYQEMKLRFFSLDIKEKKFLDFFASKLIKKCLPNQLANKNNKNDINDPNNKDTCKDITFMNEFVFLNKTQKNFKD